jgi:NADH-quinone oxidoreductase subunit A
VSIEQHLPAVVSALPRGLSAAIAPNASTEQYLPIVLLATLAFLFAAGSFAASRLLGARRPTAVKSGPYECGIVPERQPPARFPVRFYLISMIFIIFDIEIVFLYPWAVMYRQLNLFGLLEMITFVASVFVAFLYLLSNGALDWGPVKRFADTTVDRNRTSSSTIRLVPRPNPAGSSASLPRPEPSPEPEPVGEAAEKVPEPVLVGGGDAGAPETSDTEGSDGASPGQL